MKKNGFLDSLHIAAPCFENWDEMRGGDKVRFCLHCALEVNNLSAMTRKQAMRLVRQSKGKICVRYVKNPKTAAPVFAKKLYQITRRAGIAAGVLGASLSLSTLAYAQGSGNVTGSSGGETLVGWQTKIKEKQPDKNGDAVAMISGIVTDPKGTVIPNTTVVLENEKTLETRTASADEKGFYEFKHLAAGTYKMKAASANFNEIEISGIEIGEQTQIRQDVSLNTIEPLVITVEAPTFGEATAGTIAVISYELPLVAAVARDDFDEVKDLIARGANVNSKEKNFGNTTALHFAVENGNMEIARFLLDMGAKINARDKRRRTPLMSIDDDAKPEFVRMLLDYRAKTNAFDAEGNTALILAAEYENPGALRVLLDAGANVNAQNKDGETALTIAAENDCVENVRALLEAGANPNHRNKEGDAALDLTDSSEIKQLLKSHGVKEESGETMSVEG